MAAVEVLKSGRTKDATLVLCACNLWLISAIYNISIRISGKNNVADLLSRFKFDTAAWQLLQQHVFPQFFWISARINLTKLIHDL